MMSLRQVGDTLGKCKSQPETGERSDIAQLWHHQNVFQSLGASRSIWQNVECKLRCVNFRRVTDPGRAFRPAIGVTGISDDWYRCTLGVIIISLRTPWSTGENLGCTWGRRWQVWEHRHKPGSTWECQREAREHRQQAWEHLGAPQITVKQSGKNDIIFANGAGATGNHSYYLSFNDFWNWCIQFVFSSMHLYSYLSVHSITGLAVGGAWEQFEVSLKMRIKWTQRYTPRPWSTEFADSLGGGF